MLTIRNSRRNRQSVEVNGRRVGAISRAANGFVFTFEDTEFTLGAKTLDGLSLRIANHFDIR